MRKKIRSPLKIFRPQSITEQVGSIRFTHDITKGHLHQMQLDSWRLQLALEFGVGVLGIELDSVIIKGSMGVESTLAV